jgi:hypothetical protein
MVLGFFIFISCGRRWKNNFDKGEKYDDEIFCANISSKVIDIEGIKWGEDLHENSIENLTNKRVFISTRKIPK